MTRRFKKDFEGLDPTIQKKAKKAFALFRDNPWHPLLRIEQVQGRRGIWAGHVSYHYVWTFEYRKDPHTKERICYHRTIGCHDAVYAKP